MKAESNWPQCSEDLGSTAAALRQDRLLQEASFCGKSETKNTESESFTLYINLNMTHQNFIFTVEWKSNLVPRVRLYLRKPKIRIIWIHTANFFPSWCTKNLEQRTWESIVLVKELNEFFILLKELHLDNLHKLAHCIFSREQWLGKLT